MRLPTLGDRARDPVARLLRARPDLAAPPPKDLADLARRAASPLSASRAVHDLPTQTRLVLEALVLLGGPPVDLVVELSDPSPGGRRSSRRGTTCALACSSEP